MRMIFSLNLNSIRIDKFLCMEGMVGGWEIMRVVDTFGNAIILKYVCKCEEL